MFVVEQKGLVGLPYSPASPDLPYSSPCAVPLVGTVVEVVVPGTDLPPWDLSCSRLLRSGLVGPVFTGCVLSRILLEAGLAALSFALKSMPPTLT
jgi:hypothetical protein